MPEEPAPNELALAREAAAKAERSYKLGYWEQATAHASMATMFLTIHSFKENARGR